MLVTLAVMVALSMMMFLMGSMMMCRVEMWATLTPGKKR